jgi:hypothetical protein
MDGMWKEAVVNYFCVIPQVAELRKMTEYISLDFRFPRRDSNTGPSEYEAVVTDLTTETFGAAVGLPVP